MIISIINQKGGTGKTTTVVNLGAYLGQLNKKVLVIDLDPQANTTSGIGFFEKNLLGIYEVLSGQKKIEEVIQPSKFRNLYLIPANENLAGANVELVNEPERELVLAKQLGDALNQYDYMLIDTPPSLGLLTINSLAAAHQVIIPVQAEYYALEGLSQLIQTIKLVRQNLNAQLNILGALVTMYDERNRLSREVLEELYKNFPGRIFRTVIPRNVRLAEAPSFGKTILEYAPNSKGAIAYQKLARELLNLLIS